MAMPYTGPLPGHRGGRAVAVSQAPSPAAGPAVAAPRQPPRTYLPGDGEITLNHANPSYARGVIFSPEGVRSVPLRLFSPRCLEIQAALTSCITPPWFYSLSPKN